MSRRFLIITLISVLSLILFSTVFFLFVNKSSKKNEKIEVAYIHNEGQAQGTTYSVTYQQPEGIDLQQKIEDEFHRFDSSLSTYNKSSIITRINQNDPTVKTDSLFELMFSEAQKISDLTNGALDITVGPLVKAWGFAFGNSDHSKIPNVADFKAYVGYKKVRIRNHQLIKEDPRIMIDANSIAQGLSADVIGKLLRDNGCKNYMVEIGGEIVCSGFNAKGKKWSIGIDKAIDDTTGTKEQLQTIIHITNCAVTTAGGYRKFYKKDGKKYSHIINPHTGYPVENNVLSVTVVAPTGVQADGFDTPLLVLGVDSALNVCKRVKGMDCYIIYTDKHGKMQEVYSEGFKKYLTE